MRFIRAIPLSLKTHACFGVVVHQYVHSNAPEDDESVLTTVSMPLLCLLCMLKAGRRRGHWWCSTPTCSGLNPCRRPDLGAMARNSACELVRIKPPPTSQTEEVCDRCLKISATFRGTRKRHSCTLQASSKSMDHSSANGRRLFLLKSLLVLPGSQ